MIASTKTDTSADEWSLDDRVMRLPGGPPPL
jgi:hypothetical protein